MKFQSQIEQCLSTYGDVYTARLVGVITPMANSLTLAAAMQHYPTLIREAIRYGIEEALEQLAFTEAADPPPAMKCRCGRTRGPAGY